MREAGGGHCRGLRHDGATLGAIHLERPLDVVRLNRRPERLGMDFVAERQGPLLAVEPVEATYEKPPSLRFRVRMEAQVLVPLLAIDRDSAETTGQMGELRGLEPLP